MSSVLKFQDVIAVYRPSYALAPAHVHVRLFFGIADLRCVITDPCVYLMTNIKL
jgi:hypothetical protein